MAVSFLNKLFRRKNPAPEQTVISFYNTLSGNKENFTPIKRGTVSLYHCGPTVYNYQHIGNYRAYIFADLLKRLFLRAGFSVKQIINITDVGHLTSDADEGTDKMEEGARREHKSPAEIAKIYTDDFLENLTALNIDLSGTLFPRASEHVGEQIAFIKTLEEKGYTYQTSDGVYYDTSRFPDYGKLGHIDLKGLQEGTRVEANPEKRHPTDFALWKFSKKDEKRKQEWESPWGTGFPGWHIECSAMSSKYLGHHFDIHTGGIDHIPTHHQNEIAQSEAAFGKKSVNYWLHVAHLMIDGKKISKSLGNVILPKHVSDKTIPLLSYRYWLLTAHYRTQTNFTWEALEGAKTAFLKLQRYFVDELGKKKGVISKSYRTEFDTAIHDDLDTPKAIAVLWKLVKDTTVSNTDKKATLLDFDRVLGLNLAEAQAFVEQQTKGVSLKSIPSVIQELIEERETARKDKDFKKSDELREKIREAGYEIIDSESGPKLKKTSS